MTARGQDPAPGEPFWQAAFPLCEFDPDPSAMYEPSSHFGADWLERPSVPAVAVACFFGDVVERLGRELGAEVVTHLVAEHGRHAVYAIEHGGLRLAFYQAGLGAPLSATFLEEMIDYGCRTVVACGGCGALDESLVLGHVIVVQEALRDEGTSYHYLAPSRTVEAEPEVVRTIEAVLARAEVPALRGKVWSTDGLYRETRAKVRARREEGCLGVEMEAAALLAVARFRKIRLGQILYAGDSLAGDEWDERGWYRAHGLREQLFWLAAEAAVALALGPPPALEQAGEAP